MKNSLSSRLAQAITSVSPSSHMRAMNFFFTRRAGVPYEAPTSTPGNSAAMGAPWSKWDRDGSLACGVAGTAFGEGGKEGGEATSDFGDFAKFASCYGQSE